MPRPPLTRLLAPALLLSLAACTAAAGPERAAGPGPQPVARVVPAVALAPSARAVQPVAGRRVVLDPGHGGFLAEHSTSINRLVPAGGFRKPCNAVGTRTPGGYREHTFTLDVAQRAAALLRHQGVVVTLTRTDDTAVGPCVDRRAAIANAARAEAAVAIHADDASRRVRGFHVIEPALAPDRGNRGMLAPSAALAGTLRSVFGRDTGLPRATYPGYLIAPGLARRSDLAGLNLARVPAVFIECGKCATPPTTP